MSSVGPWSVKGIDSRAREIAKDQARRSGQTLGEWLNTRIIDPEAPEPTIASPYFAEREEIARTEPRPRTPPLEGRAEPRAASGGWTERYMAPDPAAEEMRRVADALGELSARIEATERRSTLAISGIDQQVAGAITRLDAVDRTHTEATIRLQDQLVEMRAAQASLGDRLRTMHDQDGPRVEAMKALEGVLGRLAAQIQDGDARERAALAAADAADAGLGDRIGSLEIGIEAAADAELVESRLSELAARLEQAEARTGLAVRALETSFGGLDRRMSDLRRDPEEAEAALDARFARLAEDFSRRIEASHATLIDMLRELDVARVAPLEAQLRGVADAVAAAEKRSTQAIDHMGREVVRIAQALGGRMTAAETRQAEAEGRLGGEVSRIADAVEARLQRNDSAQADALERLGGEIARIAERLADRIAASETRAAHDAAELGEKLGRVSDTLRARQESTSSELNRRLEASEARTLRLLAAAAPEPARTEAPAAPQPGSGAAHALAPPAAKDREPRAEPAPAATPERPATAFDTSFSGASPVSSGISPVVEPATLPLERSPAPRGSSSRQPFTGPASLSPPPRAEEDAFGPESFEPEPFVGGPFDEAPTGGEPPATRPFEAPPPPRTVAPDTAIPTTPPGPIYAPMAVAEEAAAAAVKSTSTRELIEAARAAARAAAETRKGRPAQGGETPPPPAVAAPGFESDAGPGLSMSVPWRRKRQGGATLRTFMISSVVAGSVAATGTGALMLYAGEGRRPATGEAPTAAREPKPDADMLAMALAPTPDPDVAAGKPPEAAPAARLKPSVGAPKPSIPTPQAIFAAATAAIGRNEAGGLTELRHAANLGYAPAQFYLARLYEEGRAGAPKDLAEARRWTERAALQGDPHAMFNLGLFFANGDGGARNAATAVTWFQRAANAGVRDAQYNLAVMHQNGEGTPRSAEEAYKWYLVAAASGDAGAKAGADQLRGSLGAEARAEAERAAAAMHTRLASAADHPRAE